MVRQGWDRVRPKIYPGIALGPNPRFVSRRAWACIFGPAINRTKMFGAQLLHQIQTDALLKSESLYIFG